MGYIVSSPEIQYINFVKLLNTQLLSVLGTDYLTLLNIVCIISQVGRPNNVPQAAPIIAQIQQEATKYPRIYVASIHLDLIPEDVKRYSN